MFQGSIQIVNSLKRKLHKRSKVCLFVVRTVSLETIVRQEVSESEVRVRSSGRKHLGPGLDVMSGSEVQGTSYWKFICVCLTFTSLSFYIKYVYLWVSLVPIDYTFTLSVIQFLTMFLVLSGKLFPH